MGEHRRKADGRRVFSTEFKRETVQRILTGEKTLAELSRELDIAPRVIRTWKRFAAVHASPMLRILARTAPSTAASRSASSKTRKGALPPSSIETRSTWGAAAAINR